MEVGDRMVYSAFHNLTFDEGDEVILVERARDFNGIKNDTDAWVYKLKDKKCYGANIQKFAPK